MDYNGGSMLVMNGQNCFAVASDLRFGLENYTSSCNAPKIFKMNKRLFIGITGLIGDMLTVKQNLDYHTQIYKFNNRKEIDQSVFDNILSLLLYKNRISPFFVESVSIGLDGKGNPSITITDVIGAISHSSDFAVSGTCSESLLGLCQTFWKPNMEPRELLETISNCLCLATNRDCLSGWGGIVYIVTKEKIVTKIIKTRKD
jgi:20S proteasome subunit beta 3